MEVKSSSEKIVLFINTLGSGGAQRQLVLLARELDAKGFDVVLFHYGDSSYMAYMLQGSGVSVEHACVKGMGKLGMLFNVTAALVRLKPTHLVSFIDTPNFVSSLVKLIRPSVVWVPSERNLVVGGFLKNAMWRLFSYVGAEKIVSNSASQHEWIKRNLPLVGKKSTVILNGVASELIINKPALATRKASSFVLLGRVSFQKAPDILVEAVKLLPDAVRISVAFDWYGEDDPESPGLREQLEKTVNDLGLPVRFHRATKDVVSVLDGADAFILCSRFEGTPNVLLEAMSRGKVSISTRVSDVPFILGENERGILCDVSPESLAACIVDFLALDVDEVNSIASAALMYIKKVYSSNVMADSYLRALRLIGK